MSREDNLKMMQAAIAYDLDKIKELVHQGVIHCEDDFVFEISLNHNKPEITRYVISLVHGSNIEYYVNNALVEYAHSGNISFVKEMIEMGGDIQYNQNEAVIWACGFGQLEMVKYILSLGVRLDVTDAICKAEQNNHKHVVEYLEYNIKDLQKNEFITLNL